MRRIGPVSLEGMPGGRAACYKGSLVESGRKLTYSHDRIEP